MVAWVFRKVEYRGEGLNIVAEKFYFSFGTLYCGPFGRYLICLSIRGYVMNFPSC